VIESFVEGRVRLRSAIFGAPEIAERLASELLKVDGVRRAEANPRTNGFLLEYDRTRFPMSLLMRASPLLSRMNGLAELPSEERPAAFEAIMGEFVELLNGSGDAPNGPV
jgi:hypothetical protein